MLGQLRPRVGGEVREFRERQVDLDDATAGLPPLDVVDEVVRQVLLRTVVQEGGARMQRGHHHRGQDLLALSRASPRGRAAMTSVQVTRASVRISAPNSGRALDGVGHRAHPPFGEAPVAQVTVADVTD